MSAAPQIGPDGITFPDGTIQSTAAADLITISTTIVLANTQMRTYVDSVTGRGGIVQIFTSSGSWTAPIGVSTVRATVVGGGGGAYGYGDAEAYYGGGNGGCAVGVYTVSPGVTYNITVGDGGAGGANQPGGGTPGATGGTSSFASFCSATGGTGGTHLTNGSGGSGSGGNIRNSQGSAAGMSVLTSGGSLRVVNSSSPAAWSLNSPYSAGAGGYSEFPTGGLGGAVMLEYADSAPWVGTVTDANVTAANIEIGKLRSNITAANAAIAAAGGVNSVQIFTSSSSWTAPAGVTKVKATVIGGGGGGWGGSAPNPGDGGAGGVAIGIYTVIPGTSYNVTVGTGGAFNGSGSGVAGNGGTSSFSAFCSASGGVGGSQNGGGAAGNGSGGNLRNTFVHGGAIGFLSGYDIAYVGGTWSIGSSESPGAGATTESNGGSGVVMLEY